jgi:adenine deaminase
MNLTEIIKAARGEKPADLLIANARIVNVFTGEIVNGSVAISDGYFVGFGVYDAAETLDVNHRFVAPGFIDPHVHIESSMACPTEFARAVMVRGTTCVAADPHEIANVMGVEGIKYMLRSADDQPMNFYFTLSSCVPATDMETSGAAIDAEDLNQFIGNERIVALAEMMNYPGVIFGDPDVLSKIQAAKHHNKPIDGHAPGLTGRELNAYLCAGVGSDHECTTAREAFEKLNAGMHIMIRQGTGARNLQVLLPIINAKTARRLMWCTDDRHPHDLLDDGHIDMIIREAIDRGLDPVMAIQMATINPSEYFKLNHLGAVAPGRQADFVIISDLSSLTIEQVFCRGICVAENYQMQPDIHKPEPIATTSSMNLDVDGIDFSIPAEGDRIRVIEIVPDQVITRQGISAIPSTDGLAISDPTRDLLKIAVIERHHNSGNICKGFVQGLGLKKGAIASSVAHDSHNIIVVGATDEDMQAASKAVVDMDGGLVAVCDRQPVASLPLPIAGLMSMEPVQRIREKMDQLIEASQSLGSKLKDPYMTLSFLALPVIPELKITDMGLVDVGKFEVVPLFVS